MTSQAPDHPPLRQLVLKIHSRCDLLCDHCYVYQHADQSWRSRPTFIRPETVRSVAGRLAEYAASRSLESVSVILHGGEPLLVGPARLRDICAELTRALSPHTTVDLRMHTNAVTLNRRHLDVCREFGVRVSVSLDGDRSSNDRHRLDRRGRSSYDRVVRGIRLLQEPEYRHLFSGVLCTVDVANDPVAVHDALTALRAPRIDYLLPHSTWDSPPPRPAGAETPYADWLLAIFDRWEQQGRPMPVRTFDSVLSTLRGGPSLTEALGLAPSDLAVIETDGTFEQADWLKTAYAGAPETGYDVFRHGLAEFAEHPGLLARQSGLDGLSDTCRRCPVVRSCGGGLYGHRYSSGRGFDNPSVFCADLRSLVEGIADRVTDPSFSRAVLSTPELRSANRELDAVLLRRVQEQLTPEPGWPDAWRLMVALDSDPDTAPYLDEVLGHPYVRTSLQRSLRGRADPARFMSLAAAAALRAGVGATLAWDQPGSRLHLPTLGTYRLDAPGRIEVSVTANAFRVRTGSDPKGTLVRLDATAAPPRWRPLSRLWAPDGPLVDDADPYRDCHPAAVAPPPAGEEFSERMRQAYEILEKDAPDHAGDPDAFRPTVLTPLEAGSGLQLGEHGFGALGVAVDVQPKEFARELPRIGRRARLTALRATADLYRLGSPAGALLDQADEGLGRQAYDEAARALSALTLLPERELTGTGAVLVARMWSQWAGHRG
ncbi:radical SAM/SPASM protein FxsBH, inactivated beta-hydroxylase extension form [Streptomyces griseoruber]|uniref:FxsB family radical SAM/SPASM domain protein n=1 Tax=Streptomyces griseoruber TaxID=1943 RepID=A0A117R7Z2_9ACTN|nr:radical SAM/SPASM protein FxsB, inactivated metallohydrolase extension form [Streptomyces griseoruber]KUN76036.1 FxsB family radical SAM/SPASM domain protein [Streptomyces griseoruber]